jgi:hypothetical protein
MKRKGGNFLIPYMNPPAQNQSKSGTTRRRYVFLRYLHSLCGSHFGNVTPAKHLLGDEVNLTADVDVVAKSNISTLYLFLS